MDYSFVIRREGDSVVAGSLPPSEIWLTDEFLVDADPSYVQIDESSVTFRLGNGTWRYERTGRDAERGIHFAKLISGASSEGQTP
jgi:hypothetical protein